MLKSKDAFGQGLLEYMVKGSCSEILERDDGLMFRVNKGEYFTSYKNWPMFEKNAIKSAKGRVLDIGCGAGRHGIYLQEKGHDVLGIDNSPLAVFVSKKRGFKKVRELPIEKISAKLGKFDTILLLGHNFGLFQSADKLKELLHKMDRITPADGIIIAESLDPHRTPGRDELEYRKRNIGEGRLPGHMRMRIMIKQTIGSWFDYLFVSKQEMEYLLEDTGWRVRKFIGGVMPTYVAIMEKHPGFRINR